MLERLPGVSTRFISPDFFELNREAYPTLLHRRCSVLQGPTIRVKYADFLGLRGAGSPGEMRGAERPLSTLSGHPDLTGRVSAPDSKESLLGRRSRLA